MKNLHRAGRTTWLAKGLVLCKDCGRVIPVGFGAVCADCKVRRAGGVVSIVKTAATPTPAGRADNKGA